MSKPVSKLDYINQELEILTANGKLHKEDDADFETHDVENEVTKVVRSNAVVDPRAMALRVLVGDQQGADRRTYWSCFATQRPQRRQCLLRRGFLDMQGTQKFSSSNFHSSKSCLTISLCWFLLLSLGTYPGSSTMAMM